MSIYCNRIWLIKSCSVLHNLIKITRGPPNMVLANFNDFKVYFKGILKHIIYTSYSGENFYTNGS